MEYNINNLVALWDNVIVLPIKRENKDGFVTPRNEEDKAEIGEVVALPKEPLPFNLGDIVLFNKYSTTKLDLTDFLIVRAEDIIAIIRK